MNNVYQDNQELGLKCQHGFWYAYWYQNKSIFVVVIMCIVHLIIFINENTYNKHTINKHNQYNQKFFYNFYMYLFIF